MAIWQFDIHLIPRLKLVELFGVLPSFLDPDAFNQQDWWKSEHRTLQDFEPILGSFLKPRQSWLKDIRSWGEEDGDCISLLIEDGYVAEISIRIDVRTLNHEFLAQVCSLSRMFDCTLRTEALKLVEPDQDLLLNEIVNSDAAAFLFDPVDFLDRKGTDRH